MGPQPDRSADWTVASSACYSLPMPPIPRPHPVSTDAAGSRTGDADLRRAVETGVAQLDRGERIALEDVEAWVASWDGAGERPMPTAGAGRDDRR